jgi:ATP-binding cassette, subfamily B, bacterial MsbA
MMRQRGRDGEPNRPGVNFQALRKQAREVSWGRLFTYVKPYRWQLLVALFCLALSTSTGLLLPLVAGQLINAIAGQAVAFSLDQAALFLVVVTLVQALFNFVQSYAFSFIGERVVSDLRIHAYSHLQQLSLSFFNNRRVGEITSRITNDVTLIQAAVTTNVASLLSATIQFVGAIALMLTVSWQLTSLAILLVPFVSVIGILFGRWLRRISTEVQDRLADASSVLEESVAGIRIVKSFAREPYEVGRFRNSVEATFQTAMRRARVRAVFQPVIGTAAWGAMVAILWFGGRLVLEGAMRPGDLIAFLLYAGSIAGVLGTFTGLFGQLQEALGAITRVFELIDTAPVVADRPDARELPPIQGQIVFERVDFAYDHEADAEGQEEKGTEEPGEEYEESGLILSSPSPIASKPSGVLHDLSLDIRPGEVVALVGPSGAGKSTIVNLIPRFYDVQTGSVQIDGYDVRSVTQSSLREQIGIVPQETTLFGGTVGDNIRYGRLDASQEEVEAAARAANAHDFIVRLPDGYATLVGERGVKLSGGQRQRVAIARAILKNPRILILDEATSALDSESERLVQEALERLMVDRTSIIIAHRLSTVKRADRIAVVVAGQIVELGTHGELLAKGGVYARLYAMQFREEETAALGLSALV